MSKVSSARACNLIKSTKYCDTQLFSSGPKQQEKTATAESDITCGLPPLSSAPPANNQFPFQPPSRIDDFANLAIIQELLLVL